MKLKLLPKFIIVLSLISLIPMGLLGFRLINMGQMGIKTSTLELHYHTAQKIAEDFENLISNFDREAVFIRETMSKFDWENKQLLLASMIDRDPSLKGISIISRGGAEIIKVVSGKSRKKLLNYSKNPFFARCVKNKRKVVETKPGNPPVLCLYYPFKNFVLKISVILKRVAREIESKKIGKTGFAVLMDSGGKPLIYPSGKDFQDDVEEIKGNSYVLNQALKALSIGSLEYEASDGNEYIGAYAPVPSINGAVVVRQSKSEAYENAIFMRKEALKWLLVFIFIVLGVAYLMARQLAGPIVQITRSAEHVAKGDFSRKVSISAQDELKILADTFNKMIEQLKRYSDMQVEKIIRQQQKIEAIMFSIDDGLVMLDYKMRVQLINRKARSILDISEEEKTENVALNKLVKNGRIREVLREIIKSPSPERSQEIEISSGSITRHFKCFAMEVVSPGKKSGIGIIVAFHDITLDKELVKMKDEFFHSITHDLRNPMGAIKGFVEFMLNEIPGPITEGQKKMLISMDRAAFRLLGMINNILDIAKMEAGKMEIRVEEFSLSETAKKAVELMESLGKRKNISFRTEVDENLNIKGDAGLIERVFINLIGNAIKFTPENGEIVVSCRKNGGKARCFVKDTGDGIPQDYLDKIFTKFEQVKGQKSGGTGLGLTISKYVVDAHLGKIWVESELGKGAKFIFELPVKLRKNENGNINEEKN